MIRLFKKREILFIRFLKMSEFKRMKNLKSAVLLLTLLSLSFMFGMANVPRQVADADGRAEIVYELSTERVLHRKNEKTKLPMASTTKIMTALIIVEDCDLNEVITVPDVAVGIEGSSIYLKKGERISVKDLLYGLMLRSGNDSATALAVHHSGSVAEFVAKMNDRAKELGALNTNFTNPSGLPDAEHYTTAEDLGLIACAAMKNQTFKSVVATRKYSGEFRSFINKNKILTSLEGANGVKTGYTVKAGRCLVSSAERNGMDVICVVLNCPDMYERCSNLIEDAFLHYGLLEISKDKVFMSGIVPCSLCKDYTVLIERNGELTFEVKLIDNLRKIKKGENVGKLNIYNQNNLIFTQNLYSIIER